MRNMKQAVLAIIISSAVVGYCTVCAGQPSIAGSWTFTVENVGLKLVIDQKDATVTGLLNWPHSDPIKLIGGLVGDTLTFSGDSSGENFTLHIDSIGSLKGDGTLVGTLKAHFVDFNDAHEVVRAMDQEIPWTAVRR